MRAGIGVLPRNYGATLHALRGVFICEPPIRTGLETDPCGRVPKGIATADCRASQSGIICEVVQGAFRNAGEGGLVEEEDFC